MIEVTRLNNSIFILNSELIETVEATPDTVITLVNGHRYVVRESPREVIRLAALHRVTRNLPSSST
ncbi:MAG: flagellar protein FlbD [Dethiosulfovibrio peptidovorans]|nr:MAG: flagellar protein FlbD [Dethiosulfovibrio peptidovorans]